MEPCWVLFNVWVLVRFRRLEYKRCVQVAVKRRLNFFELYFPLTLPGLFSCPVLLAGGASTEGSSPVCSCCAKAWSAMLVHQSPSAIFLGFCSNLGHRIFQYFQTCMIHQFSGTVKAILMFFLVLFWSNYTVLCLICFCSSIQLCIPKCNIWGLHSAYTNNILFYTCCCTPF